MSKVSEYLEPHIYFPMDFPIPDEPGEGDCPHENTFEWITWLLEGSITFYVCKDCGEDLTDRE